MKKTFAFIALFSCATILSAIASASALHLSSDTVYASCELNITNYIREVPDLVAISQKQINTLKYTTLQGHAKINQMYPSYVQLAQVNNLAKYYVRC